MNISLFTKYHLFLHSVLLLGILLTVLPVEAKPRAFDYDGRGIRWESGETLMKRASRMMMNNENVDSATMIYHVVASRYYTGDRNHDDVHFACDAMSNLSIIYSFHFHDYAKAYSFAMDAIRIAEQSHNRILLPKVYLNAANLFTQSSLAFRDQDDKALPLTYYKKAFHAARHSKHPELNTECIENMATYASANNLLDSIRQELSLFLADTRGSKDGEAVFARRFINEIEAERQGQWERALTLIDQLEKLPRSPYMPERFSLDLLLRRASVLRRMNRTGDALRCYSQAAGMARKHGELDYLLTAYQGLMESYRDQGSKALATDYELRYLRLRDDLLGKHLMNLQEVRALNKLRETTDRWELSELQRRNQQRVIMVVCAAAVLLLVALVVLIVMYSRLMANHRKLYEKSVDMLRQADSYRKLMEPAQPSAPQAAKYGRSSLDDSAKDDIYMNLRRVMETSDEVLSEDFSLSRLSELTGESNHHLSQVIGEKTGENFNALLNRRRITEACRRLNETDLYGDYTIEAISQSVGFRSRATFVRAFKSEVGLTPSAYLREARKRAKAAVG